jgi:hypothetical protein
MNPLVPTVHLNGTDRETLLCQANTAVRLLGAARQALLDAAPNARDFYVRGPDAFAPAQRAHRERMERIEGLIVEMADIALGIAEQGGGRGR